MNLRRFVVAPLTMLVSTMLLNGCGGGESEQSATVAPTAKPSATSATAAPSPATAVAPVTVVATQQPLATGTILDKALPYFPYELDNVRYGGNFRMAVQRMIAQFDPKFNNQAITENLRWTYEKVMAWVPDENDLLSHFEPLLAEKWDVSQDLKTYTFTLRKGIRWQNIAPVNGRELVASDVVFSMNRYREKDSIYISTYEQIDSINAPDKYTVVVKLKEPSAWGLNDLFPTGEYVVAPEVVQAYQGTIPSDAGIGTGPYLVKDYAFNVRATYVRNPDYWRKDARGRQLPYTDSIEFVFASDPATLVAGMRTKQLDFTQLTNQDIINLGKSSPETRVAISGVATGSSGFAFNSKRAPWNDVRVRRAFNMALNKERYAQIVTVTPNWRHVGAMPWSLVSDDPFTADKLGPYYKYNPSESKRLRIEAGFPDGKIKVPTPFAFAHPSMTLRSTAYQALLKEEGIEFELQPLDFSTYAPYYYQRQYKDIAISFQNGNDLTLNWVAQNKFQKDNSQNTAFIDDPEVEKVIREIKVTTDPAKLREYAKFLWDYETLGVYTIWTPVELSYYPTQARVKNFAVRSNFAFFGHQFTPWLADAPRTSP